MLRLTVASNDCYELHLNVPGSTLNFSRTENAKTSIFWILLNHEEKLLPSWKRDYVKSLTT